MTPFFELHFVTLSAPQPRPEGDELKAMAVHYSRQLAEIIRNLKPDGIFLNFEFCWDLFGVPEFVIPFDPTRIICALWDDVVFHEANLAMIEKLGLNRILVADAVSRYRYLQEGLDASFLACEGSDEIYFADSAVSPKNQVIFVGNSKKADREEMLSRLSSQVPVKIDLSRSQSYAQLAGSLRDSQIAINFSKSQPDPQGRVRFQFKGRILESIFCGALPVTETCPSTQLLFEGLVPQFGCPEEALSLIRQYLNDPVQRRRLADDLQSIAAKYRPKNIYRGLVF